MFVRVRHPTGEGFLISDFDKLATQAIPADAELARLLINWRRYVGSNCEPVLVADKEVIARAGIVGYDLVPFDSKNSPTRI